MKSVLLWMASAFLVAATVLAMYAGHVERQHNASVLVGDIIGDVDRDHGPGPGPWNAGALGTFILSGVLFVGGLAAPVER